MPAEWTESFYFLVMYFHTHVPIKELDSQIKLVLTFYIVFNRWNISKDRSSHQRCSIRKGVLRNFAKFTGRHLCQSLRPETCNFIKMETLTQVFSCEFCEISKNTFFTEHVWATASKKIQFISILYIALVMHECASQYDGRELEFVRRNYVSVNLTH